MPQTTAPSLAVCPACLPAGRPDSACTQCRGAFSGVQHEGVFLYWGRELTHRAIRTRVLLAKIGTVLTVLAFGAGIGMWLFLLFSVRETPFSVFTTAFWVSGEPVVTGFWVSMLAVLYGIMRVVRNQRQSVPIPVHELWEDAPKEIAEGLAHPWGASGWHGVAQRHDIAKSFSAEALRTTEDAYAIAERLGAATVSPYHVLQALMHFPEIQGIFVRLGVSVNEVLSLVQHQNGANTSQGRAPAYSAESVAIFFHAYIEAQAQRQNYVGLGDMLASLYHLVEPFSKVLNDLGVDNRQMDNVIAWVRVRLQLREAWSRRREAARRRPKGDTNRAMTALATPYLDSLADDLTRMAALGYTSTLIGREHELQTVFRTLQGGKKSVLLVGEEGVGKESVIEGLATRMVEESVPPVLSDKRLMVLTAARLLAGATPAVAQERLLHVLNEVHRAGNIILFIPNIENIIGVSEGDAGSLDVAGVLARELQSGSFLMFATTTPEAYRRYVQSTSISSAFSRVDVPEMSVDQTIHVLEAKAGYIEYEHGIWFSYAAIETAAQFSSRYIHEGKLPDKAIVVIKEAAEAVKTSRGKDALVTAQDIAKIISDKSKIPVTAVTEDESQKLLRLESALHERVIGQEEAVREVAAALRRSRAQLTGGKRTIANFLFLGPTGVGKTELSKTVAEVYFGGEKQMIRLDMSEYQDASSAMRLIGQAGVKGSGVLTEAIKEKPFALLLLDELEKAHPNVLNLFLQVMDDGRLTDSTGVTIDCTNIILIATSNAGTQFVQEEMTKGTAFPVIQEALMRGKLSEWYRPEFLNRFDAVVLFRALNKGEITRIATLMVKSIAARLEGQGIGLAIDEDILTYLADVGFDPQFGARPLRRVIQDRVENTIAELLLSKKVHRGDTVRFTTEGVRIEQAS